MDVTHTEHSHVIGKGGGNIKKVMEDTSCHIHFPDSNRHSANGEKSNQVWEHDVFCEQKWDPGMRALHLVTVKSKNITLSFHQDKKLGTSW